MSLAQLNVDVRNQDLPDGGARRPRRALRGLRQDASPTTPAATATARNARARRRSNGSPSARRSCCRFPTYHVVFTLPAAIGAIAFQNKAAVYDLLFRTAAETLITIAADPKHLGAASASSPCCTHGARR